MSASATYRPMDDASLRPFLSTIPAVPDLLGADQARWRVREVGDGNLNLVFIVEGTEGAVVVKQALPYVRLVGESWPLPLERSHYEHRALCEQARLAPGLVPDIYHFDRDLALIVMEFLSPHIIMRKGLVRGIEYPRFAEDVSEFMARMLFGTSVLAGAAAPYKGLVADFAPNVALCRITEDLVFTDPYRDAPLNRWTSPELDNMALSFRKDAPLKRAAQARKYQFMTAAQALLHGDLHTGSVMLTPTNTRIIDPEFACVGPIGFDVGAVLGNLMLAYFAQSGHETTAGARDGYREWLLAQVTQVWRRFEERFIALWRDSTAGEAYVAGLFADAAGQAEMAVERGRFMRTLFEDSAAFAGLKMIRRVLGLAHVEDLESITDPALRARSERRALTLARELVVGAASLSGIAEVTGMARSIEQEIA
ncbi:S-methyl-5-thioribose kinase [Phreatobacter stygius]|uniref:S-methyl-5-thioribose kinase n=1 Tax=Phreatobacter stygius TaxID=1940610 RepID=UPI00267F1E06